MIFKQPMLAYASQKEFLMTSIDITTPHIYGIHSPRPGVGTFVVCSFDGDVELVKPVWHGPDSQSFPEEFFDGGTEWHYGIVSHVRATFLKNGDPAWTFVISLEGPVVTGLGHDIDILAKNVDARNFCPAELVRLRTNDHIPLGRTVIDAFDQWEPVCIEDIKHGDTIATNNMFGVPSMMTTAAIQTVWAVSSPSRTMVSILDVMHRYVEYVEYRVQRGDRVADVWMNMLVRGPMGSRKLIMDRLFARLERDRTNDDDNSFIGPPAHLNDILSDDALRRWWSSYTLHMTQNVAKMQRDSDYIIHHPGEKFEMRDDSDTPSSINLGAIGDAIRMMWNFRQDRDIVTAVTDAVSKLWGDHGDSDLDSPMSSTRSVVDSSDDDYDPTKG
jgi:hypothetical protein